MKGFFYLVGTSLMLLLVFYLAAWILPLDLETKKENITLYDINQNIIYESNFKKNSNWAPLDEIPEWIQEIVVEIEDKRFYQHVGFDPIRIVKAVISNIKAMDIVEGGSTISQQMAKNLFLTNTQTFSRKIEELFYAAQMEMQYDKSVILEGYLNTIYYGHGIYGITSASQFFFGKPLEQCSLAQVVLLTGIPNGPSLYSPFINYEASKQRQELLLSVLYNAQIIDDAQYQQALTEELQLIEPDYQSQQADYYIQAVLDELNTLDLEWQGGHIYTYYDASVQSALDASFNKASLTDGLEASAIVIQPFSGNILALVGGSDYTVTQYNRSLYSKRQVASSIKPLLYYSALQSGFTPSTTFLSTPTTFQIDEKTSYAPTNYNDNYPNREISMINAIALSDNIYAVKTHLFLGMDTLANSLKAFHINAQPLPSLALGSIELSLLELGTIYNTFASMGYYYEPSFISRIVSRYGNDLYVRDSQKTRMLNSDITLVLNQMLTATYDPRNKTVTFPTMHGYAPIVKTAIKSGTSDFDSLVVGYNPEYTIAVWCGFDDARLLDKQYYTVSKQIYRDTFNTLYIDKKEAPWYSISEKMEAKTVDPISGEESLIGSTYWFLK